MLSGPKDPIPLCHFWLAETRAKVDLMEDEFDRPMLFEPDLVPDLAVAGESIGAWGQGVDVVRAARGYKRSEPHPHCWQACWVLSVRRKWRIRSGTSSHMEGIN